MRTLEIEVKELVASRDILGNVIPHIGEEEEKVERETRKMLGALGPAAVEPAAFAVSAQCNRMPVFDGHTETVSVKLATKASPENVRQLLEDFRGPLEMARLPSAPARPLRVFSEGDRPQPARVKMVVLGHHTIRGAAGAALLNGEFVLEKGSVRI